MGLLDEALRDYKERTGKRYREIGEDLGINTGSLHRFMSEGHDPRESTFVRILERLDSGSAGEVFRAYRYAVGSPQIRNRVSGTTA